MCDSWESRTVNLNRKNSTHSLRGLKKCFTSEGHCVSKPANRLWSVKCCKCQLHMNKTVYERKHYHQRVIKLICIEKSVKSMYHSTNTNIPLKDAHSATCLNVLHAVKTNPQPRPENWSAAAPLLCAVIVLRKNCTALHMEVRKWKKLISKKWGFLGSTELLLRLILA